MAYSVGHPPHQARQSDALPQHRQRRVDRKEAENDAAQVGGQVDLVVREEHGVDARRGDHQKGEGGRARLPEKELQNPTWRGKIHREERQRKA